MKKSTIIIFSILTILGLTLLSACGRNLSQNNPAPADQNSAGQNVSTAPLTATSSPSVGFKTFTHPGYGFSFDYPVNWNVSSFAEGEGETVLIQRASASDQRNNPRNISGQGEGGIQIYISIFDEPDTVLTKQRILQDIPDLKIANDQPMKVAGLDALRFDSVNQSGRNTKEVWLVYNGFLYQISTVVGSEAVLNKMIETWRFN